ncbi:unnamed protein product [Dimorphilus gyrociliatus]|uniref:Uncharacterized protein n=1 Tax=Dimorphilus gyrociliatus TaxID=2664684 RepID=A0A7I8VKK6_9ANNE|nr:unnamed protein product [Dimorphilus gyrociliatus]
MSHFRPIKGCVRCGQPNPSFVLAQIPVRFVPNIDESELFKRGIEERREVGDSALRSRRIDHWLNSSANREKNPTNLPSPFESSNEGETNLPKPNVPIQSRRYGSSSINFTSKSLPSIYEKDSSHFESNQHRTFDSSENRNLERTHYPTPTSNMKCHEELDALQPRKDFIPRSYTRKKDKEVRFWQLYKTLPIEGVEGGIGGSKPYTFARTDTFTKSLKQSETVQNMLRNSGPIARPHSPSYALATMQKSRYGDLALRGQKLARIKEVDRQRMRTYDLQNDLRKALNE